MACACVSFDAHQCAMIRYRRIDTFGDDASDDPDFEPCECFCHEPQEDEDEFP